MKLKRLKRLKRLTATGFLGISLGIICGVANVILDAAFSPTYAVQQFLCTGRMTNGWSYSAEFLDGRFTQIRWERSGQPPQVSRLTFESSNTQGQPIYRGSLMAAVTVTLIDLSSGDVGAGSQISVGVEEWGWSRGTCGTSSTGSGTESSGSITALRQNLLGMDSTQAREWLRKNNFFFTQTIEQTNTRVVEQWHRDSDRMIVHVIFNSSVVSDVTPAR